MRLLMRNCLQYTQQCQNGIFEKRVGQQWYPNQLHGSSLNIMYTLKCGEFPNTNRHKHALQPNISLKLICEEKCSSRFEVPNLHIV